MRHSRALRALCALAAVAPLAALMIPTGEPAARGQAAKALPADLAVVPADVPALLTLRPAELRKDPMFSAAVALLDIDVLDQRELLVPLADVERVTFLLNPRGPVFLVRTAKPYDLKKVLAARPGGRRAAPAEKDDTGKEKVEFTKTTVAGKTIYHRDSKFSYGPALAVVDSQVYIIGRPSDLKTALGSKAARGAELTRALGLADQHTMVAFAQGARLRESLARARRDIDGRDGKPADKKERPAPFILPPELLPYQPILEGKNALLTADVKPGLKLDLTFTAEKGADLDEAETSLKTALYVLRRTFDLVETEADLAAAAPLFKPIKDGLRAAKRTRKGDTFTTSVSVTLGAADRKKLAAAVARAVSEQRAMNTLKQIGLAFHMYHDTNNHLPPPAITAPGEKGKPGKALLSWRVAILPYIEQENLYRQFKLDEPWDSDHNKKLLASMPKVYAPPAGVKTKEAHSTFYQVFTGPNTPFPSLDSKASFARFKDGLSNTLVVAEAADAVPWTKPADMVVDAKKPLPKLGAALDGVFLTVLGDGSVRRIKRDTDAKWLRRLIDPRDGEVIDWAKIDPKK